MANIFRIVTCIQQIINRNNHMLMWRGAISYISQLSDAGALTNGDDVVADTSVAVSTIVVGGLSSLSLLALMSGRSASACAPRL